MSTRASQNVVDGLVPDLIAMGEIIGGGLPIGAGVLIDEPSEAWRR